MNKDLRKVIMIWSKLKNIFHRVKAEQARIACKKQRNICTNLVIKTKTLFQTPLLSDNKTFWKTVKPAFGVKICSQDNYHNH